MSATPVYDALAAEYRGRRAGAERAKREPITRVVDEAKRQGSRHEDETPEALAYGATIPERMRAMLRASLGR